MSLVSTRIFCVQGKPRSIRDGVTMVSLFVFSARSMIAIGIGTEQTTLARIIL